MTAGDTTGLLWPPHLDEEGGLEWRGGYGVRGEPRICVHGPLLHDLLVSGWCGLRVVLTRFGDRRSPQQVDPRRRPDSPVRVRHLGSGDLLRFGWTYGDTLTYRVVAHLDLDDIPRTGLRRFGDRVRADLYHPGGVRRCWHLQWPD